MGSDLIRIPSCFLHTAAQRPLKVDGQLERDRVREKKGKTANMGRRAGMAENAKLADCEPPTTSNAERGKRGSKKRQWHQ